MSEPGEEGTSTAPALPWPRLLPWQGEAARRLLGERERFPHALLLYGPRGIGKHTLALNLAQGLLCERPQPDGVACGSCPGCRYAVAGQHPDLMRLELTVIDEETGEPTVAESISIERIRGLIEFVQLTSHRQGWKAAVIAPAERMNPAAANALLKTLEEPPPRTALILVTGERARLPATIRSRCRQLAAPQPSAAEAIAWVGAHASGNATALLAQAGGGPLAALALADEATQRERAAWLAALARPEALAVLVLAARIEAGGRDERRPRLAHAIDWLLGWTSDLARAMAGVGPRRNPDFAAPLAALAPRVAPARLFRYHRTLLHQRALLAHPLQPRLVAEALLIDYCTVFN